jgi:ribonuclease P protein component
MNEASFPRANRLLRKRDFDRVFAKRTSAAAGPIVVYVARNEVRAPRLGLIVSRKIGSATVRNRWKRRLREAFRLEKHDLPDIDVVVIVRHAGAAGLDQVRKTLIGTVRRLAARR